METSNETQREALALSLWDAGLVRPEHLAQAVVAHILDHPLLAARGDSAPTVSTEQVDAAARSLTPTLALVHAQRRQVLAVLAGLGIEVTP